MILEMATMDLLTGLVNKKSRDLRGGQAKEVNS